MAEEIKAGKKTSEFWKSIAVHVVAIVIMAFGAYKESEMLMGVGAILMAAQGSSYNISRGLAKRGVLSLFLCCVLFMPGCTGIRASAIDESLRGVVERHAAYTEVDASLSDLEKRVNLRDGTLLIEILDEALKGE